MGKDARHLNREDDSLDFTHEDDLRECEICAPIDKIAKGSQVPLKAVKEMISFLTVQLPLHLLDEEEDLFPLQNAVGRVLSHPARALGMVPPFANAAMDGIATNTADLTGDGPWDLPVSGCVAAGQAPEASQWYKYLPVRRFLPGPMLW